LAELLLELLLRGLRRTRVAQDALGVHEADLYRFLRDGGNARDGKRARGKPTEELHPALPVSMSGTNCRIEVRTRCRSGTAAAACDRPRACAAAPRCSASTDRSATARSARCPRSSADRSG